VNLKILWSISLKLQVPPKATQHYLLRKLSEAKLQRLKPPRVSGDDVVGLLQHLGYEVIGHEEAISDLGKSRL